MDLSSNSDGSCPACLIKEKNLKKKYYSPLPNNQVWRRLPVFRFFEVYMVFSAKDCKPYKYSEQSLRLALPSAEMTTKPFCNEGKSGQTTTVLCMYDDIVYIGKIPLSH